MLVEVVVIGLVSFRLWRLIAQDDLTDPLKRATLQRIRESSRERVANFFDCPWCSGFWITGLITLIAWQTGLTQDPLWVWPAASVVVGWLGGTT